MTHASPLIPMKTMVPTVCALIAFAANSVICRWALMGGAIDASSFTIIRMVSGAMILIPILCLKKNRTASREKGGWLASAALFAYATTFSFAYIHLETGTGALILFGAVQITMILVSLISGIRLHMAEWAGLALAFSGFVYLILPGVTAPSPMGFCIMTLSGIAWALYTLLGRNSKDPLMDTAYNFLRALPMVALLALITLKGAHVSFKGVALAMIAGGITSGAGYALWYMALGGLSVTQAAVIQLLVPVIAALGGVLFVFEPITPRLILSATMILGGIFTLVLGNHYLNPSDHKGPEAQG